MNRNKPYVGISGLVECKQQFLYEDVRRSHEVLRVDRGLLMGVKAVHNTQWLDRPNKYGSDWYPVGPDQFRKVLIDSDAFYEGEMGVAQMYLDPEAVRQQSDYPEQFIDRVMVRGNRWLTHVQFDMLPFHNPESREWGSAIERIRRRGHGVIMQCHGPAMAQGADVALDQLRRLPPLDYVLFDASHGTGKRLNPEALLPFLDAAYGDSELEARGTNFGLAGGLSAAVVSEDLPSIVREFPDVSWDAEGRLHIPLDATYEPGRLDDEAVAAYLDASARVLEGRASR